MITIINIEPIIEAVRVKFLQPKGYLKGTSRYKFAKIPRQVAYPFPIRNTGLKTPIKATPTFLKWNTIQERTLQQYCGR